MQILILFFCWCFSPLVQAKVVSVKDRLFLPASSSAKIWFKPKGAAVLSEDSRGVHVFAKKVGPLQLNIDGKMHDYHFLQAEDVSLYEQAQALLASRQGLHMDLQDGEIRIGGQLHRSVDWLDLVTLSRSTQGHYQMRPQVDMDLQKRLEKHLQEVLTKAGFPWAKIEWKPYPRISVAKLEVGEMNRLIDCLRPYGIKPEVFSLALSVQPLVLVTLTIAEISHSVQKDLGIAWPTEAAFQLAPKFSGTQTLQAMLKAAVAKGEAQILASPKLVAKSGGTAEFLAGGEFPIRVSSIGRKDVVWKQHGIFLKIAPKTNPQKQIQMDITAEISMPEASYDGETIPSLRTNRVSSQFDLQEPATIVLSGLVQNVESRNFSGPFGLQSLPILGRLFRSESFQNHQTELVIFVSPDVVDSPGTLKPELPAGIKQGVGQNDVGT